MYPTCVVSDGGKQKQRDCGVNDEQEEGLLVNHECSSLPTSVGVLICVFDGLAKPVRARRATLFYITYNRRRNQTIMKYRPCIEYCQPWH